MSTKSLLAQIQTVFFKGPDFSVNDFIAQAQENSEYSYELVVNSGRTIQYSLTFNAKAALAALELPCFKGIYFGTTEDGLTQDATTTIAQIQRIVQMVDLLRKGSLTGCQSDSSNIVKHRDYAKEWYFLFYNLKMRMLAWPSVSLWLEKQYCTICYQGCADSSSLSLYTIDNFYELEQRLQKLIEWKEDIDKGLRL